MTEQQHERLIAAIGGAPFCAELAATGGEPIGMAIAAIERLSAELRERESVVERINRVAERAGTEAADWKNEADAWKGACVKLAETIGANRRLYHLIPIGVELSVVDLGTRAIAHLTRELDDIQAERDNLRARLESTHNAHAGTMQRLKEAEKALYVSDVQTDVAETESAYLLALLTWAAGRLGFPVGCGQDPALPEYLSIGLELEGEPLTFSVARGHEYLFGNVAADWQKWPDPETCDTYHRIETLLELTAADATAAMQC